ncbi:GNAT family N-acetyltransferase [Actinoplanes sp. NPDC049265]|uniref:GNAT family N-acetyltransferase n=1 Tax=Actinoplanes sp. NPDC049265 TaxID=3363902 RepID=UPI00371818C4
MVELRPATEADAEAMGRVWASAWRDGHLGLVPEELAEVRTPESFLERAAARVADTTVADVDGVLAGFFMVDRDEVEQVFVDAPHRGTGVAAALLAEAERRVAAAGHPAAWLAVVDGNARARRFYEKAGWHDAGPFDYAARDGARTIPVPCRRYVKDVSGGAAIPR